MAQKRQMLLTATFFLAMAGSIILYQVPVYQLTMVIKTNNDMNPVQYVSNHLESFFICRPFLIFSENGTVVFRKKFNKLDSALQCLGQMTKVVRVGAGTTGPCINSYGQKSVCKRLLDSNVVEEYSTPEVVRLNKTNIFRYFLFTLLLFAFILAITSFRKSTKRSSGRLATIYT